MEFEFRNFVRYLCYGAILCVLLEQADSSTVSNTAVPSVSSQRVDATSSQAPSPTAANATTFKPGVVPTVSNAAQSSVSAVQPDQEAGVISTPLATNDATTLNATASQSGTAVEKKFHVIISVMIAVLVFIFVVSCTCGLMTLFGLTTDRCLRRSKKIPFHSMPSYDLPLETTTSKSRHEEVDSGKRQPKRDNSASEAERGDQIECIAMQEHSDRM